MELVPRLSNLISLNIWKQPTNSNLRTAKSQLQNAFGAADPSSTTPLTQEQRDLITRCYGLMLHAWHNHTSLKDPISVN
jgi:hypothetical protein